MRRPGVALGLLIATAGCGGPPAVDVPSPTVTTIASPAPSPSLTPTPTLQPTPSDEPSAGEMPPSFGPDLEPAEVPVEALVPAGADVTGQWFAFTEDGVVILVAWVEPGDDPLALPRGFASWRRAASPPHWRAAFVERLSARTGVREIQMSTTDVSGDGSDDALVYEGLGGSGACGRWLVIDLLRSVRTFGTRLCDGGVEPSDPGSPGLVVTESVFRPGDAHCCPSAIRRTTLSWDGGRWRVTDEDVTPT
jgi:hypothetical protein